jgi:DNA-binding GntR family transcriptional regulator
LESVLIAIVAKHSAVKRLEAGLIRELEELLDRMDDCLDNGLMQDWLSLDHQFHSKLIALCDNPHIVECVSASRSLMNLTLWFITPKYADRRQSSQDHRAILAAIENGDPDAARNASSSHIFRVKNSFMEAIKLPRESPAVFGKP